MDEQSFKEKKSKTVLISVAVALAVLAAIGIGYIASAKFFLHSWPFAISELPSQVPTDSSNPIAKEQENKTDWYKYGSIVDDYSFEYPSNFSLTKTMQPINEIVSVEVTGNTDLISRFDPIRDGESGMILDFSEVVESGILIKFSAAENKDLSEVTLRNDFGQDVTINQRFVNGKDVIEVIKLGNDIHRRTIFFKYPDKNRTLVVEGNIGYYQSLEFINENERHLGEFNQILETIHVGLNEGEKEFWQAQYRNIRRIEDVYDIRSAIEDYSSDNKKFPVNLDELVPEYIPSIPIVPLPIDNPPNQSTCSSYAEYKYELINSGNKFNLIFCISHPVSLDLAGFGVAGIEDNYGVGVHIDSGVLEDFEE